MISEKYELLCVSCDGEHIVNTTAVNKIVVMTRYDVFWIQLQGDLYICQYLVRSVEFSTSGHPRHLERRYQADHLEIEKDHNANEYSSSEPVTSLIDNVNLVCCFFCD